MKVKKMIKLLRMCIIKLSIFKVLKLSNVMMKLKEDYIKYFLLVHGHLILNRVSLMKRQT
jgi:hypothetical protein